MPIVLPHPRPHRGSPLSLQVLYWEKRAHGGHPSIVGCFLGAPTSVSAHESCKGISGLHLGNVIVMEKWKELATTSAQI